MATAQDLVGRPAEVYERVQAGMAPKDIADQLGVSRNAVYQVIGRLKREGYIADDGAQRTAPRRRTQPAPRPMDTDDVLADVERLVERSRARLTAIEQQEEELAQERERIARLMDRLEGVAAPS